MELNNENFLKYYGDPEIKAQAVTWIEALRSGKYSQGRNCLQSEGGYCCLGVACEVLIDSSKQYRSLVSDRYVSSKFLIGVWPGDQPHCPGWLRTLDDNISDLFGVSLMRANDSSNVPFTEIADFLEALLVEGDIEKALGVKSVVENGKQGEGWKQ